MSFNQFCVDAIRIPAAEHYGWRGTLVAFQAACLAAYVAATWLHRGRIFVPVKQRGWDLDAAFMTSSICAAATGVLSWGYWMVLNALSVETQKKRVSGDLQQVALAYDPQVSANAVYLFAKPFTVAMYTASQLLVALRLLDLVNIGRGAKARLFKRRVRIATLVVFVLVNIPSFAGCWILFVV